MKLFMERNTNQLLLPGIIVDNPRCQGYDPIDDVSCNNGLFKAFGLGESDCHECDGTGVQYEVLDVDE